VIVATAGHVDHGKTALVKALTGVDTDRLPEEKRRGLSIDIGFAYTPLASGDVLGFVDVPGHERFISNMLAGVAAINFALLVVAADDGIMPQTREHLAILDLLDVPAGAIALTKTDRVPPARVVEVSEQIRHLVAGTALEKATIFPVSNVTGTGTPELRDYLHHSAARQSASRSAGNFRLAVDRCFTLNGVGVVVTGAVFSGTVKVGDSLVVSPSGLEVRVRSLHAQNRVADSGHAGQRVALNLSGARVEKQDIHRGDWLVAPAAHHPTQRIDARVRVIASESAPLKHLTPVHVHIGSSDVQGRVALLEGNPIAPGESGLVQIVLDRPVLAVHGDRVVLRDQSAQRTVAGGGVLDPFAPAKGRAKGARIGFVRILELQSPEHILRAALALAESGLDLVWFARALNLTEKQAEQLWSHVEFVRAGKPPASFGIERHRWRALSSEILSALQEWHRRYPEKLGASERDVARTLTMKVAPQVLTAALNALVLARGIHLQAQRYFLPGHKSALTAEEATLWRKVQPLLAAGDTRPPVVPEIADQLGTSVKPVLALLDRAAELGLVHRIAPTRFFLPEPIGKLARVAEKLSADKLDGCFEAADYRDHSGIGRRVSVEMLEFFDRVGLTRRLKNGRKLMRPVAQVFFEGRESTPGGAPGLQNR
jgi:selenocysteine-specific elongation factor